MADNKVLLTAGEAIKKEGTAAASIAPFTFVARNATGIVAAAAASTAQVAIADLTSANGMDSKFTYAIGDLLPIIYPTNGCEVNVSAVDATYAVGDLLAIGTGGKITKAGTGGAGAIGVCLEAATTGGGKIKMEVLK